VIGHHYLLVPDDPDEAMLIEHPKDCPQHGQLASVKTPEDAYVCEFERVQWETGLDCFFTSEADTHPFFGDRKFLKPGRHAIVYRFTHDLDVLELAEAGDAA
jgi:hypothetical protein